MIRNADGTPYQVVGELRVFDPCDSRERQLQSSYDAEILQFSGAPILYYEYILDSAMIDPIYHEEGERYFLRFQLRCILLTILFLLRIIKICLELMDLTTSFLRSIMMPR